MATHKANRAGIPALPAPELYPVDRLRFDRDNPRLMGLLNSGQSETDVLKVLWREMAVDEIAMSIAANGYFGHEPLFGVREGNTVTVVEGNRRLAAIRMLRDSSLQRTMRVDSVPTLSAAELTKLASVPVIVSPSREELWEYVGFKHVNGPQTWQPLSKAKYIAWVRDSLGVELVEIAKHIGDRNDTVQRLYAAFKVLEQAERAQAFDRNDRYKSHFAFSHLYTGMSYLNIQKFIGFDPNKFTGKNPIPKAKLQAFGEFAVWLYGSKSKAVPPIIRSQNPDLRQLDEALGAPEGVVALRRGLQLPAAVDAARGDVALFREALQAGKQALQRARGTMLTGFAGEPDMLRIADDIRALGSKLFSEMAEVKLPQPKSKSGTKSRRR